MGWLGAAKGWNEPIYLSGDLDSDTANSPALTPNIADDGSGEPVYIKGDAMSGSLKCAEEVFGAPTDDALYRLPHESSGCANVAVRVFSDEGESSLAVMEVGGQIKGILAE